jgi:hypothetical protein
LPQTARRGAWNDGANLLAVVESASQETPTGLLLAAAEFNSERNHTYIRQQLGAKSVIPAKLGEENVARPNLRWAHANPQNPAARIEFQCVPFDTSLPFPKEVVNKPRWLQAILEQYSRH